MRKYASAMAIVAVLGIGIGAQQQGRGTSSPQTGQPSQGQMSMEDMMKGCREHCATMSKSLDGLAKTIADGKASKDPAKMRAALEQAEKPVADMRQHMTTCMNMMTMMQNMQRMMGGQQQPSR